MLAIPSHSHSLSLSLSFPMFALVPFSRGGGVLVNKTKQTTKPKKQTKTKKQTKKPMTPPPSTHEKKTRKVIKKLFELSFAAASAGSSMRRLLVEHKACEKKLKKFKDLHPSFSSEMA